MPITGCEGCRLLCAVVASSDYGATVAKELMARSHEGDLAVSFDSVTLFNGGIYPELHRSEPALQSATPSSTAATHTRAKARVRSMAPFYSDSGK